MPSTQEKAALSAEQRIARGVTAALACETLEITNPEQELPALVTLARLAADYSEAVGSAVLGNDLTRWAQLDKEFRAAIDQLAKVRA